MLRSFSTSSVLVIFSVLFLVGIFLTGERSNTIRAFLGLIIFYLAYKEYGIKKKIIFFTSIFFFFLLLISNSQFLKMRYVSQIKF